MTYSLEFSRETIPPIAQIYKGKMTFERSGWYDGDTITLTAHVDGYADASVVFTADEGESET